MKSPLLTLFYDGHCPFCAAEMGRLKRWNVAGRLGFVDITAPGFDPAVLGVGMSELNRELHALDNAKRLRVGTDAILVACTLVGRGWLVAPLRVAALRPLLAALYRSFARNRYRMSRWLGYKAAPVCDAGTCSTVHPLPDRRR